MAESIKEHHYKEEAISNIAIQIAKIGVKIKKSRLPPESSRSHL